MQKIQLIGIINLEKLENYIESSMIDIAYIDEVQNDSIRLLLDERIDIENPDDKIWLDELFKKAFLECQEYKVKIIWGSVT